MNTLDQTSLLETEARILAENDTHAVIALRIEKRWLGRNLPFFAALADVVTHRPNQHHVKADA